MKLEAGERRDFTVGYFGGLVSLNGRRGEGEKASKAAYQQVAAA